MSDAVRNLSDSSEEEEETKQNNSDSSDSNSDSDSSSSDSSDDSSSDSDSNDDSTKPSQQSDSVESAQTTQTAALPADSDQAALDLDLSDDLDLVQDKTGWGSLDEIQQFLTNSVPTSVPGHCPVDPVFVDHEDSQHATQMDSLGKY